ncbi:hypothetical protein ANN_23059 [Periplaneta americana]|uniref:Uncharacterized protein n=1 Tax=Periplaneta americana TaxID=6978 RepID=A0ABQ8SLG7_PERAM|nr:hypothetical protein ANN_23059 [Periplaneta americana]
MCVCRYHENFSNLHEKISGVLPGFGASIKYFIQIPVSDHQKKNEAMKNVNIFSDGCAGQLKCKYNFSNITLLKEQFNLFNLTWTFFATSHGKGAVDGIGAVVKRKVWNLVRARKVTVRDADTFARACSSLKVNVIHVKSEEINSMTQKLGKAWENTLPITRTQNIQHVIAVSTYKIKYKYFPQNSSELEEYLCPEIRKRRRKASISSQVKKSVSLVVRTLVLHIK